MDQWCWPVFYRIQTFLWNSGKKKTFKTDIIQAYEGNGRLKELDIYEYSTIACKYKAESNRVIDSVRQAITSQSLQFSRLSTKKNTWFVADNDFILLGTPYSTVVEPAWVKPRLGLSEENCKMSAFDFCPTSKGSVTSHIADAVTLGFLACEPQKSHYVSEAFRSS